MSTQISVPVATSKFLELSDFLRNAGDPRDPVTVVTVAIDYWLSNAESKPELLSLTNSNGYQWKSLFLPDQTQIRMAYKGTNHYAKVEGDELIYDGTPTSPGSMANSITNSSRNAWRDLWIKRPQDREWYLADVLREATQIDVKKVLEDLLSTGEKSS
ncbi:hypothetical protein [Stenotrophobium rhamnosiphilum]|uniref:Uncharacterized protein n=1 Tax=Stenotrophobium rhamnosiphilum TaxID=2029166 RepID=A0A2T5MB01_9GAMM|nr:hypothetical protein [Stenotrophobium rhamnosiphilum]PTU27724.1 hypothetical protein CJD38_18125 [Stenotrophobium rhamnosiphilum]